MIFLIMLVFFFANQSPAQSKTEQIVDLVETYHELNTFNGSILIQHKGEILLNTGFGYKNTSEKSKAYSTSVFQIGSITKQFTATVMLKLEEKGKLSIQDPVSKYIPALNVADKITIYQLLTHTSGIYNYTDNNEFMQHHLEQPTSQAAMIQLLNQQPLDFDPGTKMKYSNSGYLLLGYIIESVTGEKYETVVRQLIFNPLKMINSGFDFAHLTNSQKATGYNNIRDGIGKPTIIVDSTVSFAGGAIYSTTGDLLKWHLAISDKKFLKPALKEKLFTPYLNNFGMGWVTDKFYEKNAVFHNGSIPGFTSNFYRIESDNTCIIILNYIANQQIDSITRNLLCILYDKPYSKPVVKAAIPFSAAEVTKYTGEYQFEGNFRMKIYLQDNKLFAQRIGEEDSFEMFLYKKDSFFLKAFEADLIFSKDAMDTIQGVCLIQSKKTMCAKKDTDH